MQFDSNTKFKAIINSTAAADLRSQPAGRDKFGNVYWCTLDDQCNLRVFQENLDDETWKIVAKLVKLHFSEFRMILFKYDLILESVKNMFQIIF